jgi:hypothetical protein
MARPGGVTKIFFVVSILFFGDSGASLKGLFVDEGDAGPTRIDIHAL